MKQTKFLKVGDVAKATGVSVRTLHHYEEIGLLPVSGREAESGHRVFTKESLQTLQQVLSLKQLGFSLAEIRDCVLEKRFSPLQIVRLHLERVLAEREHLDKLFDQLSTVERTLAASGNPSVEELLTTIGVIQMHEKYFSKEQLEKMKSRQSNLGDEKILEYQNQWTTLMERVRAHAQTKTDPSLPDVQALAKEWNSLVQAFSGGDAAIEVKLGSMYRNEPALRQKVGLDAELSEYVAQMMAFFHKTRK